MNDSEGTTKQKRIAIVGAGVSGICSIVSLKEEGLEPVCFEATDKYGGLWNYREESIEGVASLMPSTILNHSKEMGAFSNFPPKKQCHNYMRHTEVFQYLTNYYKQHDCGKHIKFNTEVLSVRKAKDYISSGQFSVTVRDKASENVTTDNFDGVMVCTGHFSYPKMENFPGLDNFKGKVIHSHSLKNTDEFTDQKVLVIGTGCSGLDAAEGVSTAATQVYLSARSGMHVFSRIGPNGYPIDYLLFRKYLTYLLDHLPTSLISWYLETFYIDTRFDHNLYYMKPTYHVLSKDPILNESISYKLLSGSVIQKGQVERFTENGVVFHGEDTVTEIDSVIMATGYIVKFPFLETGLLEKEGGRFNLYKCMYPTNLPHSSLVFIGLINPYGPGFPLAEIQSRWAALVLSGKNKLPSSEIMLQDAIERHETNKRRYTPSEFMSIRVDYVSFLDEIAEQMGAKPNLVKYCFTDFPLFLRLVLGASLPYQYRLQGPHRWERAREAIMTCEERVHWPLTRENIAAKGFFQRLYEYIGNLVPKNMFFL